MFARESEIIRNIRLIETLKADLVVNAGKLLQAMAQNSEHAVKDGLASIVVSCYVLGRRLGIDFAQMDEAIENRAARAAQNEDDAERRFGDFSQCRSHFRRKR